MLYAHPRTGLITLTAGVRTTHDRKSIDIVRAIQVGPVQLPPGTAIGGRSWWATTPKFGVQYRGLDNVLFYASYSEGFRSGGFNARASGQAQLNEFRPERAHVIEAGAKSDWFGGRLRVNGSIWQNKWDDVQFIVLENGGTTNKNAGDAKLKGAELEITAKPVPSLTFNGHVGHIDARYTRITPEAAPLTTSGPVSYTPSWTYGLGIQQAIALGAAGQLTARADYSHVGGIAYVALVRKAPAYDLVNARLTWRPAAASPVSISLYALNLFDERYVLSNQDDRAGTTGNYNEIIGPPREVGVEASWRF